MRFGHRWVPVEGFPVKIGILGTGRVGGTLGRRWSEVGHHVFWGTRYPEERRLRELANRAHTAIGTWPEAIDASEIVVLALPWPIALHAASQYAAHLAGRVVVDCTNPLNEDFSDLVLGFTTSAAEQIAAQVPQAKLVKAFNTVSAATMANPKYNHDSASLFYCGDDVQAKQLVAELARDLGFQPVDAGPLRNARWLEPVAMLYIYLACHGWGSNCALHVLTRGKPPPTPVCSG